MKLEIVEYLEKMVIQPLQIQRSQESGSRGTQEEAPKVYGQ